VAAPVNKLLADHTPERRDEIWRAIEAAVAERAAADGSLDLPGEVIYVAGRR
jgi:hypothetical protein